MEKEIKIKKPHPFLKSFQFIVFLVIAIIIYTLAFHYTEIDFKKLTNKSKMAKAKIVLSGLFRPDVIDPKTDEQTSQRVEFIPTKIEHFKYFWSDNVGGKFNNPTANPEWIPPSDFSGPATLTLTLKDAKDNEKEFPITSEVYTEFECEITGPSIEELQKTSGPYITLSKYCGGKKEEITVEGHNFKPLSEGQMWIEDPIGKDSRLYRIGEKTEFAEFKTDENGNFTTTFNVPAVDYKGIGLEHYIEAKVIRKIGGSTASKTLKQVAEKMIETVFLALMATSLGILVAIPMSFMAAKNLMRGHPVTLSIYYIVRAIFNILRSIEPLIIAIVFTVWLGLGPFAGVLALALHSIAALGKLYSEQIEAIDSGPIEAVASTGANKMQVIRFAVVPQIIPQFLAFTIYRWDINVRMSTIIGFVGGGGIGYLLQQFINLMQYERAGTAVWAIAIVVSAFDFISAIIREKVM